MGHKKNIAINDDEYSLPQDDTTPATNPMSPSPKKEKPKKGGNKNGKKGGKYALHGDDEYEPPPRSTSSTSARPALITPRSASGPSRGGPRGRCRHHGGSPGGLNQLRSLLGLAPSMPLGDPLT
jgi:hypothetical protein